MAKNRTRVLGVTLIELLVTISVVGLLSAIAVPSFTSLIKNGRLATETNDLMVDLAFARAEAARRGKRVTLCVSSDSVACSTGAAWAGGRIVFSDSGAYGTVDSGDEVLRANKSVTAKNVTISATGFTVSTTSTLNYIQFKPNGAVNSETNGFFTICDDRSGNFGRKLEVFTTGRTSLTSTAEICP